VRRVPGRSQPARSTSDQPRLPRTLDVRWADPSGALIVRGNRGHRCAFANGGVMHARHVHQRVSSNGRSHLAQGTRVRRVPLVDQALPQLDTHCLTLSRSHSLVYPQLSHQSRPRSRFHSSRSPPTTSHSGQAIEGAIRASMALLQFLPPPGRPPATSAPPISQPYIGPHARCAMTYWRCVPMSRLAPAQGPDMSI